MASVEAAGPVWQWEPRVGTGTPEVSSHLRLRPMRLWMNFWTWALPLILLYSLVNSPSECLWDLCGDSRGQWLHLPATASRTNHEHSNASPPTPMEPCIPSPSPHHLGQPLQLESSAPWATPQGGNATSRWRLPCPRRVGVLVLTCPWGPPGAWPTAARRHCRLSCWARCGRARLHGAPSCMLEQRRGAQKEWFKTTQEQALNTAASRQESPEHTWARICATLAKFHKKKGEKKGSLKNIFVKHHTGKPPALAFTDVITLPQGCRNVRLLLIQHKRGGEEAGEVINKYPETQS